MDTKLSRLAQKELNYLRKGGSSICTLVVRELVRKGFITVDKWQFSNSPYSGISVSLIESNT